MAKNARPFFRGIPSGPDVAKLIDAFGIPEPGIITHDSISKVIDQPLETHRYVSVVHQWRKRLMREYNIQMVGERGVGYRILSETERVDFARHGLARNAKLVVRQHQHALLIDVNKLDEPTRKKHDHVVRASASMASAVQNTERELANALRPPEQLPRGQFS